MNWIFILLPSGLDTILSLRIVNPAEGATVSLSQVLRNAFIAAAAFLPVSLFSIANKSSRLFTFDPARTDQLPNIALMRGSIRGSPASFEGMTSYAPLSCDYV